MDAMKYLEYLDFYSRRYDRWNSEYAGVKDFTFDLWFVLKNGASLKDAVRTLADGKDYNTAAICVSDDAVHALGEEKDSLFKLCEERKITLLRDDAGIYYNYHDGREYCIHTEEGYGMVDDAATYLCIWWKKIPTPEEAEEEKLRREELDRKRCMKEGKSACIKYCLNRIEQVEILERRLQEMIQDLKKRYESLPRTENAELLAPKMRLLGKIKALDYNLKVIANAREYLLEPESLQEN